MHNINIKILKLYKSYINETKLELWEKWNNGSGRKPRDNFPPSSVYSRIPFDTFNHHPVYHGIAIDSGRNTVSSGQD